MGNHSLTNTIPWPPQTSLATLLSYCEFGNRLYCDFVTENSSCHTYFQGPVSVTVLIVVTTQWAAATALTCCHWSRLSPNMGSHLYVPCKSVSDQDQNWIKQSKPSLGGWSREPGDLQTIRLRTCSCNLTFDPWKSSDQEPHSANDQVIKHTFWKTWLWS